MPTTPRCLLAIAKSMTSFASAGDICARSIARMSRVVILWVSRSSAAWVDVNASIASSTVNRYSSLEKEGDGRGMVRSSR